MSTTVTVTQDATARLSAHEARAESLAFAKARLLPMIAIHGNIFPIRKLLWAFGGSYDRTTRTWSVPQHKAAEAQAIADRFSKPHTSAPVTVSIPAPVVAARQELIPGIRKKSDADVLSAVAGTSSKKSPSGSTIATVLDRLDGLLGVMAATPVDLVERCGCSPAEAERIVAAAELTRRLSQASRRVRPVLQTPEAVHALLCLRLAPLSHEELWCLPLDTKSHLIGEPVMVSRGDVDATDAGPRAFFRIALARGASSCIAVHNHPTGDPTPSTADFSVTSRLVAAGRTIDVPLVDHVIIGDAGRFVSIRRDRMDCFL